MRKPTGRVDFHPETGLGKFSLEIHGSLAVLLGLNAPQTAETPTVGDCGVDLGAGVRIQSHLTPKKKFKA